MSRKIHVIESMKSLIKAAGHKGKLRHEALKGCPDSLLSWSRVVALTLAARRTWPEYRSSLPGAVPVPGSLCRTIAREVLTNMLGRKPQEFDPAVLVECHALTTIRLLREAQVHPGIVPFHLACFFLGCGERESGPPWSFFTRGTAEVLSRDPRYSSLAVGVAVHLAACGKEDCTAREWGRSLQVVETTEEREPRPEVLNLTKIFGIPLTIKLFPGVSVLSVHLVSVGLIASLGGGFMSSHAGTGPAPTIQSPLREGTGAILLPTAGTGGSAGSAPSTHGGGSAGARPAAGAGGTGADPGPTGGRGGAAGAAGAGGDPGPTGGRGGAAGAGGAAGSGGDPGPTGGRGGSGGSGGGNGGNGGDPGPTGGRGGSGGNGGGGGNGGTGGDVVDPPRPGPLTNTTVTVRDALMTSVVARLGRKSSCSVSVDSRTYFISATAQTITGPFEADPSTRGQRIRRVLNAAIGAPQCKGDL